MAEPWHSQCATGELLIEKFTCCLVVAPEVVRPAELEPSGYSGQKIWFGDCGCCSQSMWMCRASCPPCLPTQLALCTSAPHYAGRCLSVEKHGDRVCCPFPFPHQAPANTCKPHSTRHTQPHPYIYLIPLTATSLREKRSRPSTCSLWHPASHSLPPSPILDPCNWRGDPSPLYLNPPCRTLTHPSLPPSPPSTLHDSNPTGTFPRERTSRPFTGSCGRCSTWSARASTWSCLTPHTSPATQTWLTPTCSPATGAICGALSPSCQHTGATSRVASLQVGRLITVAVTVVGQDLKPDAPLEAKRGSWGRFHTHLILATCYHVGSCTGWPCYSESIAPTMTALP